MEQQPNVKWNLGTIPAKTLLNYVTKAQLTEALGPNTFSLLQDQARAEGKRVTAAFLKAHVMQDANFVNQIRNSPLGQQAFQKYVANAQRLTDPAVRAKSRQVRSEMAQPRRGMRGCLATKVPIEAYGECLDSYDKPEYQNVELVPRSALKQRVYQKTGSVALAPRPGAHISELPRGLRAYIRANPEAYREYLAKLELKKNEYKYLKSVGRTVGEPAGKRTRGEGESIYGACEWCSEEDSEE